MAFGVQVFSASGALLFDTTTVLGGSVAADFKNYAASAAGETLSYPQWAGYSAFILDCGGATGPVSLDMSSGYPVVTVLSTSYEKSFALIVY